MRENQGNSQLPPLPRKGASPGRSDQAPVTALFAAGKTEQHPDLVTSTVRSSAGKLKRPRRAVFFMSACLRRIVRRGHSGSAFRPGFLIDCPFATLAEAAALKPIPLVACPPPHIGGCVLHPGTHWSRPIAGQKVGGSHTSGERDDGTERTRVLILSAQVDVSNPVFGFTPALLHVFPLLARVLPELGQPLFGPFTNLAARLLHVLQAVPDALSQGRQALPEKLSSLGSRLRCGQ